MNILCEFHYPGNIRSLRNLIYELTSFANDNEIISTALVNSALSRLRSRESDRVSTANSDLPRSSSNLNDPISLGDVRDFTSSQLELCLSSIVEEGDILLPLELCVLRRDETFKQWTARAKRCSIEAAPQATGGSMRRVAERLGLTRCSLLGHLSRAKQTQNQAHFDWEIASHEEP